MSLLANLFGYVLNFLYNLVNNYGVAIILFCVVLKLITLPISIKQQKTMKKSAKIQAKMQEIQEKYKNDQVRMNQEMLDVYKQEKMSPFSGCLSSIVQIIVFLAVFYLVRSPLTFMKKVDPEIISNYQTQIEQENDGKASAYPEIQIIEQKGAEDERVFINMDFLGIDLSKVPTQSLNDWRVYIIPLLYILTSIISVRMTINMQKKQADKDKKKDVVIEDGKVQEEEEINPMEQMNKSMMYMMPIMSIMIAIIAPLGLALYWLVSNILMIIERLIINKIMSYKEEKREAVSDAK